MQALQGRADHWICASLTVTTNTLSPRVVDPVHAALNARIAGLAEQGLTMRAIADNLNADGIRSATGKRFYAKLVGALLSKERQKSGERMVQTLCKIELRVVSDRFLGQAR